MPLNNLITLAQDTTAKHQSLPFAIYTSVKEQRLCDVPISKPLLIFVLGGSKQLKGATQTLCESGQFIFLGNTPKVDMRNIPSDQDYFALLVEFEYEDFACLGSTPPVPSSRVQPYIQGDITAALSTLMKQFIEWSAIAPPALWKTRRQELLLWLQQSGFQHLADLAKAPNLSQKIHQLICTDYSQEQSAQDIAQQLAMSESTLRRKLSAEGNSLQLLKDRARLGYGLHLVQTTTQPIMQIADACGYQSQSRFTERFKQQFSITPSDLRKTQMRDMGEQLTG